MNFLLNFKNCKKDLAYVIESFGITGGLVGASERGLSMRRRIYQAKFKTFGVTGERSERGFGSEQSEPLIAEVFKLAKSEFKKKLNNF
jgi:hypothetical protein